MPRAAVLLALLVPLVACRDGPTAPPDPTLAFAAAGALPEHADALSTATQLLKDPLVRLILRARFGGNVPPGLFGDDGDGSGGGILFTVAATEPADTLDPGDLVVYDAAIELLQTVIAADTIAN